MKYLLIAAAMAAMPFAAMADRATGDACAASLSPDAKRIYEAVAPSVPPTGEIRPLLEQKVRGMVMGGSMSRGDARAAAPLAGECLKKIQ